MSCSMNPYPPPPPTRSETCSEIRARSLKQPLSDSVEVKHRVPLVSAALGSAASGSEQKLQLVWTELQFLCPPPLGSHWNQHTLITSSQDLISTGSH